MKPGGNSRRIAHIQVNQRARTLAREPAAFWRACKPAAVWARCAAMTPGTPRYPPRMRRFASLLVFLPALMLGYMQSVLAQTAPAPMDSMPAARAEIEK